MSNAAAIDLSDVERAQLGSLRLRRDGIPSTHPYPPAGLWPQIRSYLVERSLKANPQLDPALTAYTPGETVGLLRAPTVAAWHRSVLEPLPERYRTVVLVPCAKTKPWEGPAVSRSKLYSAYNALRAERDDICFVTISEPLGIVPMQRWADFPQYDNSGLFHDDSQRSGMTTKEWLASPFAHCYGLPFDAGAWQQSIELLGSVVGSYLALQGGRRIIAAVDTATGPATTHGEMLNVALNATGVAVERYPKRLEPRVSPLDYLREVIEGTATDARLPERVPSRLPAKPGLASLAESAATPAAVAGVSALALS